MHGTPETITAEESTKIVGHLNASSNTPTGYKRFIKVSTLYILMLEGGLRIGEAVRLPRSSLCVFDTIGNCIVIPANITKTKTERIVPMSSNIYHRCQEMQKIIWQPDNTPLDGYAFYVNDFSKHFTIRNFEKILETAAAKTIGRKVTPHMLRHTFASRLARRTNIRVVQKLLGHKCLTSTQIYTHPSQQDLVDAINGSKDAAL